MIRRRRCASGLLSKITTAAFSDSRRLTIQAPIKPCAPVTRKVLLLSPSANSSRNDLPDLICYLRERIVDFHLAEKRTLHRAPHDLFDFRIARELWRDQNVTGDDLL